MGNQQPVNGQAGGGGHPGVLPPGVGGQQQQGQGQGGQQGQGSNNNPNDPHNQGGGQGRQTYSGGYIPTQNQGQQQGYPGAFNAGGGGGGGAEEDIHRTPSDASMTIMDGDQLHSSVQQHGGTGGGGTGTGTGGNGNGTGTAESIENWLDDDTVPTVFRWEHGGRQVYITGTFNGWSRQIPMHRSGNDFTYIHNLKRGKHAFKFIVDDEWRFAPDQPTVADIEGRINNFIDVTDFLAYTGDKDFEKEKAAAEYGAVETKDGEGDGVEVDSTTDKDGEVFTHNMPDMDDYTKEPPPLPPHLRHIILNKPPQLQDTAALPVPQHVALNHLYCTAIKDNMMVLGITQRFKTKFVTTVYYSPCSSK
jgi:5'-AMP-activated protein kinase regulatory beta subunit